MTAVSATIDRLREMGYELELDPPAAIRFRFVGSGDPPHEAAALLGELQRHKPEALELLAEGLEWNESGEQARLDRAYDSCDRLARTVPSWSDAWTWCRAERPDLGDAVDAALDAIDDAFRAEDTAASMEACRALVEAVRAVAAQYRSASESRRRCPA